jgi:hypothetical protein
MGHPTKWDCPGSAAVIDGIKERTLVHSLASDDERARRRRVVSDRDMTMNVTPAALAPELQMHHSTVVTGREALKASVGSTPFLHRGTAGTNIQAPDIAPSKTGNAQVYVP